MSRAKILGGAGDATEVREVQFGNPEDNLGLAADLWSQYLKQRESHQPISPQDVCIMMVLFKVARLAHGQASAMTPEQIEWADETLIDIAGYAAIASELHNV